MMNLDLKNDEVRSKWLEKEGFQVIRFWNNEVLQNTDGVFLRIKEVLDNASPSP